MTDTSAQKTPMPIRFSPDGPPGFFDTPDDPLPIAILREGVPMGRDSLFYQRPEVGLKAGIWRSCPYVEDYESYPCDEYMFVLKGHAFVETETTSEAFREGDSFLIPKGFRGRWRQPVEMVKFYVIIE